MVKLYLDSASLDEIREYGHPTVSGYTTNPTLMRKAGIDYYDLWGKTIADLNVSMEVIADDFEEMYRQAKVISSWGENIFVKIPVTNTEGDFSGKLIKRLTNQGIKVNVTAVMTKVQIKAVLKSLNKNTRSIISVFAGRIADTQVDPCGIVKYAVKLTRPYRNIDVLWASPRQVYDIVLAEQCGADIITVSKDILAKLALKGKDLTEFSRETVQMFKDDAEAAGYSL